STYGSPDSQRFRCRWRSAHQLWAASAFLAVAQTQILSNQPIQSLRACPPCSASHQSFSAPTVAQRPTTKLHQGRIGCVKKPCNINELHSFQCDIRITKKLDLPASLS